MKKKPQSIIYKYIPFFAILICLLLWQIANMMEFVPKYILPSPVEVIQALVAEFPLLLEHSKVTLLEAVLGLFFGVLFGFISAALMDTFETVRKGLYPILILTQTVPPVAIAPLLILWFSYGIVPKVILVVLVSFFPIAIGLLEGFQSVDPDMIKLMRMMKASSWQIFWHVKFPHALGEFFSGLKIAVSYSVVGAVIAEWLGGYSGLGVYMTRVKKSYDYDKMFAVILLISIISLALTGLVKFLQHKTMPWNHCKEK